jgi:hypothetical protein
LSRYPDEFVHFPSWETFSTHICLVGYCIGKIVA